jgi:hypothetical protein
VKGGKRNAGQGSFGHLAGGYDAGYYGWVLEFCVSSRTYRRRTRYTYSLVFAADMYSAVFKSDPLDPTRGERYRRSILEPGGSREELDSLKVKEVNLSWILETLTIFVGIPWTLAKSGGIYGGNIWKVVNIRDYPFDNTVDKSEKRFRWLKLYS